ncbi:uncharacterized protein LOC111256596 [Setaria italica]|uniref:uncharacterized protein LOC111256596 n=1 Tax=Setaria italica TaxID=4555 RepID=UPI000BE57E14|nr:uncharacterized protein LOC111256596 [Setaria italica]
MDVLPLISHSLSFQSTKTEISCSNKSVLLLRPSSHAPEQQFGGDWRCRVTVLDHVKLPPLIGDVPPFHLSFVISTLPSLTILAMHATMDGLLDINSTRTDAVCAPPLYLACRLPRRPLSSSPVTIEPTSADHKSTQIGIVCAED